MNEETYPFITRKLQQAFENGSTPGVALLVDHVGEVIYRHAVGYAQQYPEHKDLHEDTIFDIASLTKVVATTTAIMLLVQQDKLSLEESVQTYIPEFPHQEVTFLHLLTHSSGLPGWWPLYEEVQSAIEKQDDDILGNGTAQNIILKNICNVALTAAPGAQYTYSDLGFILLGIAIERISDRPLDIYCEENIFAPLGMSQTFFHRYGEPLREGEYVATERCEWRRRILYGDVHDENAYALGGVAGHAGLFSTLDDVRLFMNCLLRCYEGHDDFLPQTLVQRFFTRQHLPQGSTRALGWDTPSPKDSTGGELLSSTSVGHTGFTGTSIWLDLSRKVLILLFSNRVHPSRNDRTFLKMRPKIHDTVLITFDKEFHQ
jgi:CubicO group peptidase (beta-lactamase class C family)